MTSLKPHYLFKGSISKYSHVECYGFNANFGGCNSVHATLPPLCPHLRNTTLWGPKKPALLRPAFSTDLSLLTTSPLHTFLVAIDCHESPLHTMTLSPGGECNLKLKRLWVPDILLFSYYILLYSPERHSHTKRDKAKQTIHIKNQQQNLKIFCCEGGQSQDRILQT